MKKITSHSRLSVALILLLTFVLGCASQPVSPGSSPKNGLRQWEGKAQLFDRAKDRKHTVDMDLLAEGQKRLRLDVAGSFAVSVAAAVVNGDQMTCLLPRQKRFYQGPASAEALSAALQAPLDPQILYSVLWDEKIRAPGWSCEMAGSHLPQQCENPKTSQKVIWAKRADNRKKVSIIDPRFEVELSLNEIQPKVQDLDRAFTLNIPPDYKAIAR